MPEIRTAKRYQKSNGKEPFTKWIKKLDRTLRVRIHAKIKSLEVGNFSDCSVLKDTGGVKETRIRTASGIRIYFAEDGQDIILLLIGGDKDSQDNDISKAIEYWQDYKERK